MMLAGDGPFTRRCHASLEQTTGCRNALLTHGYTATLETAKILADIQTDNEMITTSYTFISTAHTFMQRGSLPELVEICPDTLKIDETLIGPAFTKHAEAIVLVHYAGVATSDYLRHHWMGFSLRLSPRHQ